MKNTKIILVILVAIILFSSVSFSNGFDKISNKVSNKTSNVETKKMISDKIGDLNEDETLEDTREFDELVIDEKVYIDNYALDEFYMKTKNLKIITEGRVMLDVEQTSNIMIYAILNELECLDFSNAKFKDNTYASSTLVSPTNLSEIILPDDIETIQEYSFYGFSSLKKINFPTKLKKISKAAFSDCKSLEEIVLNDKLEIIDEQAFLGCNSLNKVILPDSVNVLGRFCFGSCENLAELYFPYNDKITINGNITSVKKTIFIVYYKSAAYKLMFKLDELGPKIETMNKIVLMERITKENFTKQPQIIQKKDTINVGDNVSIEEIINVDIKGTGIMSFSLSLIENKQIKEYDSGKYDIEYNIRYYLGDIDISKILGELVKVEDIEEIKRSNSKFFVFSKIYDEKVTFELKIENYKNGLTKNVDYLTCQNSYALNQIMHEPFLNGFKDGTFKPMRNLTNAEVAKILANLSKYNPNNIYESNFSDVSETAWYKNYVGYVTREEIMKSNGDMFYPENNINRIDFVVACAKALRLEEAKEGSSFPDVWGKTGEGYVKTLEDLNVISGFKDGSFGPYKNITRAEAVKILVSLLNRVPDTGKLCEEVKNEMIFSDVSEKSWYYIYILEATTKHYHYKLH